MARVGTKGKYAYTEVEVLDAIKDSGGIVAEVQRNLGCLHRYTVDKYVNKWASTRRAFSDEAESMLDEAESKMYEMIRDKDGTMIRFLLSTKGKARGYTERKEILSTDVTKLNIDSLIKEVKGEFNESKPSGGDT